MPITGKTISKVNNLAGSRNNMLTLIGYVRYIAHQSKSGYGTRYSPVVLVRCDCGNEVEMYLSSFKNKRVKSCGCWKRQNNKNMSTKHGMARSSTYKSWSAMIQRCTNSKTIHSQNYIGRGIMVCGRWRKFENFLADMGEKPSKAHTIDRINNDGNYEPSNCRWATRQQQANNTRRVQKEIPTYILNGCEKTLPEWAKEYKVDMVLVWKRVNRGWDLMEALTFPVIKSRKGRKDLKKRKPRTKK